MPRKAKGIHSSPAKAGEQNFSKEYIEAHKADELTISIMQKTKFLLENRTNYKGQWTEEQFKEYVDKYFDFTLEIGLEPSRPALILWLDIDKGYFSKLVNSDSVKGNILRNALTRMELTYFAKLDSRPVPQMFKLKTGFNYVETQKVEVEAEAKVTAEEIADKIDKIL